MRRICIAYVETNCKKNGPIKQTLNIIKHLDRKVFDPVLITVWTEEENNSMIDEYRQIDIPVYCCNLTKSESIVFGKSRVSKLLKHIGADIVHAVGMPLYRMALGYKETIHLTTLRNYCYEDYPDYYGEILGNLMAFFDMKLIKQQIKLGNPFLTCSKSLTDMYMCNECISIKYIQNGVDIENYRKRNFKEVVNLRNKLNLPVDKKIFIYSGGFIDRKNQIEVVHGYLNMKNKNDIIIIFLGEGDTYQEIKSYCKDFNGILFMGKVQNVEEYLQASDVYISTSKSEGLPNGVLEAMACGLPVILSNIPQHMEIYDLDNNCGYTYQLGNPKELSYYMEKILKEDMFFKGDCSYDVVMNNFTSENMSKKYQSFYMDIIASRRPKLC